ncbi:LysR family transcriptional regulator [Serinicoccus marinus]|uniref:LysR family transcriptional regulator n=1 Tax=Serinicoccus marinus TaxID=247333 RepID=UPI0003B5C8D1|nr:LysR family transcriptional regulator [Serinicoccus marinus]
MLELRRLRLLVELSRRGTVGAVAQALSYSPSTVSSQLGALEKEAGVALLEPVGRRVRLTAAGELLVTHAVRLLAELERAEAGLAALGAEVTGRVRVAAFQSAVLALLPPTLIDLRGRHPDLRVEVTELEPDVSLPTLAGGDYDLVLAEEYPGHPLPRTLGVTREDLLTDGLHLIVPRGWGEVRLSDLAGRPMAMEPPGTPAHEWAVRACREAGFEPDVLITTTDLQVQLRMVENGLAAALLPQLAEAAQRPAVRIIPLPGRPRRRVFTATRTGGQSRPAISAVIQALSLADPNQE